MTKDLKVSIVQTKLFWQEPNKNIRHLNKLLSSLKKKETDVIVLPEMFTTGFSMMPNVFAEEMNGPAMQWMQDVAKSLNANSCSYCKYAAQ
jgi:predicted amidohydrolase